MDGDPTGQICYNAYWLFRRSFLYVLTKNLTPLERPYPPRDSDPTNSVLTLNRALAKKNERVKGYRRNLVWAWTTVYWRNAMRSVVEHVSSPRRLACYLGGALLFVGVS
mmetsp:Transcript_6022/g.12498  ORF Transcript_6022/g.12498 Transcript_6022/m.12498 type:complete len:109 (-) Transcript_6022:109-435(-)